MAIHHDGTGAALGGVTAHMGASQQQLFAQKLNQQSVRWDVKLLAFSVYFEFDLHAGALLSCLGGLKM
jgi:hypothetical protein